MHRQSETARLIQQRLHGGGGPLPAAARRPLPHFFQLRRDRAQGEFRIGDGNAGDERHQPVFRGPPRRSFDQVRRRHPFTDQPVNRSAQLFDRPTLALVVQHPRGRIRCTVGSQVDAEAMRSPT